MQHKNCRGFKHLVIPSVTDLVTAAANTKATETEKKKPGLTNLATKAALNTKATDTENKMADTSTLIRKADNSREIMEIENQKIPDVNDFDAKLRHINNKVTNTSKQCKDIPKQN